MAVETKPSGAPKDPWKSKTLWFSISLLTAGIIDLLMGPASPIRDLVPEDKLGVVLSLLGAISATLRFMTAGPIDLGGFGGGGKT